MQVISSDSAQIHATMLALGGEAFRGALTDINLTNWPECLRSRWGSPPEDWCLEHLGTIASLVAFPLEGLLYVLDVLRCQGIEERERDRVHDAESE